MDVMEAYQQYVWTNQATDMRLRLSFVHIDIKSVIFKNAI